MPSVDTSDLQPPWLQSRRDGVALTVLAAPGARTTEVVGEHGDALKIRVAAQATDGKANSLLLRYVSARLGIPVRDVRLVFGKSARRKGLLITGLRPQEVINRLKSERES